MLNRAQRALGGAAAVAAAMAALLLAACGGGTEQITPFEPTRLLVFGDEMSVLTGADDPPQGRKYSVNALDADDSTMLDCVARPQWFQIVAYTYDFAFEQCNPSNLPQTLAKILAAPGAKAADFPAQVAAARALGGGFSATDLGTVLIGANDVLELYRDRYVPNPTTETYNAIITELQARGARLGQQIEALTQEGPRLIVSTIPLMGQTPYALREAIDRPAIGAINALSEFSRAFNTAIRVNIVNNGQYWGLVELDALINAGATDPSRYGLSNAVGAVCAVDLPNCTTNTLVPNGNATTWLWASDIWMGTTAHFNLGQFARGRALGNPF